MNFKQRLQRFFYGRNGADQLYNAVLLVTLVLIAVNSFFKNWILTVLVLGLLFYANFRFFSRNIYKRQQENRAFLHFFSKIKGWFKLQRDRFRDRKTHVYLKCPKCKNVLRLPRISGAHTVCCPCCQNRFQTKV